MSKILVHLRKHKWCYVYSVGVVVNAPVQGYLNPDNVKDAFMVSALWPIVVPSMILVWLIEKGQKMKRGY